MILTEAQKQAGILLFTQLLEAQADAELSHSDIRKALSDQLATGHPNDYAYVMDTYGDDEAGDVVYQHGGSSFKAPYSLGTANGKRTAEIDEDSKKAVMPRTVYDEQADDDDNYTAMEEAFKTANLYTALPLYERFISKSERDSADDSDFAGKGKSFPILKPADIMAAVRSMGRAGSSNLGPSGIKSRIIAIAKRKGWTKYLPKGWQDGSENATESRHSSGDGMLVLCEAAATLETIKLVEAKADYEIKLIAPGAGSSAFYPKEVLKRDGPNVFKAGTHVYLNHPTQAEEAARPEGDVKNLAGVLTTAAAYQETHAKGPGLYARMKVFADHAQTVEEKAPHVGMSIRASGVAESGKKQNGLPILKELTSAESVDVVTRPGAGGMILTEAAKTAANQQEADMTAEEVQKLVEAGVRKATLPTRAREEAARLLEGVTLPKQAKVRVIETAVATLDVNADLDIEKFGKVVAEAAKSEGEYLASITGGARILGMGSAPVAPDPAKLKEARERAEVDIKESERVFMEIGMPENFAKISAKGRAA